MRELLPYNDDEFFAHKQYHYLQQRLYEIKRQRPSSTTLSDTTDAFSNRLSVPSSCFSSTFDVDSSLPCENNFIGDSCQGGVPCKSETLSLSDLATDAKSTSTKQYMSSKSSVTSVESAFMSPRVSELDNSSNSSVHHMSKRRTCRLCHFKHKNRIRMVRFKEPESQVISSTDEEVTASECEPCELCLLKDKSTTSQEPYTRLSEQKPVTHSENSK